MDTFIYFVGILAICLFLKFLFDTYVKGERYDPQGRRIDNNHKMDYDDSKKIVENFFGESTVEDHSLWKKAKTATIKRLIDNKESAEEILKSNKQLISKKYEKPGDDAFAHMIKIWKQEFYDNMGFMIAKSTETQGMRDFVCYYNGPNDFASEIGREKTLNWLNSSDSFMSYAGSFRVHYGKEYVQFGDDYIQSRVIGIYLIRMLHPNFISIEQLEYLTNIAFELEGKTHPYLLNDYAELCFEKNNFREAIDYYNLAIWKTSKNEHYDLYSLYERLLKTYREINSSALSAVIATAEEKKKYHYDLWTSELDDDSENEIDRIDDSLPF